MAKETTLAEIKVQLVNGMPTGTGDPDVFYFDEGSIPEGKEGWGEATVWYYWDAVASEFKVGVGPRPKPHH